MTGSHAGSVFGNPTMQRAAEMSFIQPREDQAGECTEDPDLSPARGCGPIGPVCRKDWYTSVKAVADYLAAGVLLVLTFPILLAAGILTRATSRGPAIYCQTRLSRWGREFTIYKIRSMYVDCERTTGPRWSTPNDPRLTPLGKFLRRTHIDELPQLLNVLRGEMSLIGPRPERPEFVREIEKLIPFYRDRERILPGVTGLAQIQLPPDTDVFEVHHKLACDLYYLQNQSPWLDLRILMCTAMKVVGIPTRVSCRLLGIPSGPVVEEAYCRLVSSARESEPPGALSAEPESPSAWDDSVDAERALACRD
jgi:lipopolysaccharide/colanic/teichoic acid biosynthesis glycosyltransferase